MTTQPGEVIKPDTFKCIADEGMPIAGKPYEKGNLYVRFDVQFPDSLSPAAVAALKSVLPPAPAPSSTPMDTDEEPESVHMTHVGSAEKLQEILKSRMKYGQGGGAAYNDSDDDDDMPRGGQRVQCAQQ